MTDDLSIVVLLGRALAPAPRTETLEALRKTITTGDVSWERVVELANAHLVSPALWSGLKEKGLAGELPADLAAYLAELHCLNTKRNRAIAGQLRETLKTLNNGGIEPLLLKGAAHLFENAFSDDGTRMMTDIDLLVPENTLADALRALEQFGYGADPKKLEQFSCDHHYAPLVKEGEPASIELHSHVLIERCRHLLPTEAAWANSRSTAIDGLQMRVLRPTYRVLHALVHAQIADVCHLRGTINLRQLHDMAATATRFQTEVQWRELRSIANAVGEQHTIDGALGLLRSFLNLELPTDGAPGVAGRLHVQRCRQRLVSERFRSWDKRFQNLSAYSLERRFGLPDGRFPLMRARWRYAISLITR